MPNNIVLSNVGFIHLDSDQVETPPFDTISGQFTFVVKDIPEDASIFIEQRFPRSDGLPAPWVPIYEFAAIDQIDNGSVKGGSQQLEIPTGTYRITATQAGGESWASRSGTPHP